MAEMKDAAFLAEADSWIDAHWEEIVEEIGNLVAVPSVVDFDAATPEHPSGPDAHAGMTAALDLASRLGFPTTDEAGEIGWADLEGESEIQLGMICHADVVVPGVGWTSDPWTMQRRDGFLIGRGVLDDKGPLVISLYAMKFFAERCEAEGKKLPYTIRMLVGTNEETGTMKDVGYYLAHHKAPAFLFTSDAEFSVCYGEKGGFDGLITSKKLEGGNIVDFTTGDAATNAVPSQATLVVKANAAELPAPAGFEVTDAGDGCAKIVATGKGGHASLPEGTVNAIGMLARYALEHDLCSEDEAEFLRLAVKIMDSTDGSSIGIDTADAYFDPLTCIAGTIHMVDAHLELTIDIRYPTSTTNDELQAKIAAVAADYHATCENTLTLVPFLVDPQSPAIQMLASSYHDATGLDGDPFTIGGGTYAREFPCAASFGPEDPHDEYPEWVGPMHGADEGISEETLRRAMRTYILAIKRLMEIDLESLAK